MTNISELINELNTLLETHPLRCPECGGAKHSSEAICEDCQIAYLVDNTSDDNYQWLK